MRSEKQPLYHLNINSPMNLYEVPKCTMLDGTLVEATTTDRDVYFSPNNQLPFEVTIKNSPVYPYFQNGEIAPLLMKATSDSQIIREYRSISNALCLRGMFDRAIYVLETAKSFESPKYLRVGSSTRLD